MQTKIARHPAYIPRPPSYTLAYQPICELFEQGNYRPIPIDKVRRRLECKPGIMFAQGTRLDEVFDKLKRWRLLFIGIPHGLTGEHAIPLTWRR